MNPDPRFSRPGRCARIAAAAAIALGLLIPLQALAAGAAVSLSDPVPSLLDGARVTSNADRLATGGRAVEGVAADGVSRIVVAVGAATPGESFTFTVYDDQQAPSASTARDGGLAAAGSNDFNHNRLATAAVTTGQGAMAFVVYRAPVDFARPGGGDDASSKRSVSIHWSASGSGASGAIPVTVVRPPVVLIHGLWSNPDTWDDFTPLITDARFSTYRANYETLKQPITDSAPFTPSPVSAHSLGFRFDARYVAPQIDSFIHTFKAGDNPANAPVSDVQADVVAHSMGGDVTRTMPLIPGFASATTFGRGNVHKVITIDTPHLGTPLAEDLINGGGNDANRCVRMVFDVGIGYTLDKATTPSGATVDGAMGDLKGNGSGGALSPALQALLSSSTNPPLQTKLLPTAFIAGIAGPAQYEGFTYCRAHPLARQCRKYSALRLSCAVDPLVQDMTATDWVVKVMMGKSDTLVPYASEYDNYSYAPVTVTAIHTASLEELGLVGPGVLKRKAGTAPKVITLLNTWVRNSPPFAHLR